MEGTWQLVPPRLSDKDLEQQSLMYVRYSQGSTAPDSAPWTAAMFQLSQRVCYSAQTTWNRLHWKVTPVENHTALWLRSSTVNLMKSDSSNSKLTICDWLLLWCWFRRLSGCRTDVFMLLSLWVELFPDKNSSPCCSPTWLRLASADISGDICSSLGCQSGSFSFTSPMKSGAMFTATVSYTLNVVPPHTAGEVEELEVSINHRRMNGVEAGYLVKKELFDDWL